MMRTAQLLIGFALAIGWLGSPAWAAGESASGLRQPVNIRQLSFEYDSLALVDQPTGKSPSDAAPAPTRCDECCEPACCEGECNCYDCSSGCGCGCGPCTLPQPCFLSSRGIKMGGWIQQGITANNWNPVDQFNGPVALNDRHGEYQMNQLWFFLDRPTNTGGYGWDIGGHFDIMYGTDWRYGIANGLEDRINAEDQFYGIVIPQIYAEIAYNDFKVRAGRFAGLLAYELVPAVANFFYSHSYTMCYTEPQLVTGVMADYQLSPQWLIQGGFHQGWYMWEDINDYKDFMGGVRWTSYDKRTSLSYHLTTGRQDGLAQTATKNWYAHSIVYQRQLSNRTKYVLQHNLGYADDLLPQTHQDAEWYTVNQYLFYKINSKWEAGLRLEWMRDDDGARVGGVGTNPDYPTLRTWQGAGYAGNFWELTMGLNWKPSPNVRLRPEIRYDWYDGLTSPVSDPLPFNDGNSAYQWTFGVDLIVTF